MYNFVLCIVVDGIGILQEFFMNSCRNNSWSRDGCYHSCSKQTASEFFKNSEGIPGEITAGQEMDFTILVQSRWHRNSSRILLFPTYQLVKGWMLSFLFKAYGIRILQEFQQNSCRKSSWSSQVAIDAIILVLGQRVVCIGVEVKFSSGL